MEELDPDWVMLYLRDQATRYEGLNPITIDRLKMDEDKFVVDSGNVTESLKMDVESRISPPPSAGIPSYTITVS